MTNLISTYKQSCILAEKQILLLRRKLSALNENCPENPDELSDLKRRINLLYTERHEMLDIIHFLEACLKWRNANE